jgi:hypothetical protein
MDSLNLTRLSLANEIRTRVFRSALKPRLWNVGDAGEHIGQPGERIDVIEFRRHDERRDGCRPISATLGTGEEPRLP